MIDNFVKSIKTVMPDLIRHPEDTEMTGPDLRRNDALRGFQSFYKTIIADILRQGAPKIRLDTDKIYTLLLFQVKTCL